MGVLNGVQRVGVLLIIGVQVGLLVALVEVVALLALGQLGHKGAGSHLFKHFGGHIGAVDRPEVGAVAVAAGGGLGLEGGDGGIQAVPDFVLGVAVLHGLLGQGQITLGGLQGGLHEIVPVGLVVLLAEELLVIALGGVKAQVSAHTGVIIAGVIIVVAQLRRGELLISQGEGGGPGLEKAGVPDQQRGHQHRDDTANHGIDDDLALLGGLLLLELGGPLGRTGVLTLLFLSGCAHGISILSVFV